MKKKTLGQSTYKTCSTCIHFGFFLSDILNSLPSKWKLNSLFFSVCECCSTELNFCWATNFDDVKPKKVVEKMSESRMEKRFERKHSPNGTHIEELKMHQLYTMKVWKCSWKRIFSSSWNKCNNKKNSTGERLCTYLNR